MRRLCDVIRHSLAETRTAALHGGLATMSAATGAGLQFEEVRCPCGAPKALDGVHQVAPTELAQPALRRELAVAPPEGGKLGLELWDVPLPVACRLLPHSQPKDTGHLGRSPVILGDRVRKLPPAGPAQFGEEGHLLSGGLTLEGRLLQFQGDVAEVEPVAPGLEGPRAPHPAHH